MTAEQRLRRVVERHFPGSELRAAQTLTGGVSADVSRLDLCHADGSEMRAVLRVHGRTHAGHDAGLEFRLLQSLHRAGLPVPEPLCFDASRQFLEHPYLLVAFVDGSTTIPEATADACIVTMAELLAAVHATAIAAFPTLPMRLDPVPELLEFLPAGPEWCALRSRLLALEGTAFEGSPVLLHGDFWPGNLIWREGRIAAVLDWEDAAVGDPLSDVACTCLELRYLYGRRGAARFEKAYAGDLVPDPRRFALWQAYVAAAAQRYMGDWGLEPSREAHMRRTALESIREAASSLAAYESN